MNKTQRKINEYMKKVDGSFHYKEGIIKFSPEPAESFEHFLAKCLIAWEFKNAGLDYYTEARFCNKTRADIFIPFWNKAIEIVSSEPASSLMAKKVRYPCEIKIVKAEDIIRQNGIKFFKR